MNNNSKCLMIAHRGVSVLETENTCAAFVAAGVKSYFGIETDVHVTKDGRLIICHDDNIKRVSGVDMVIEQSEYEDLKKVKLFDTDGKNLRSDLCLPDLNDYLLICKKYRKYAVLELKNNMEKRDIEKIVEAVKNTEWFCNTIFISFSRSNLLNLRDIAPDASLQFLTDVADKDTLEFLEKANCDLDIFYGVAEEAFIKLVHERGRKVNVWTVDDSATAEKFVLMGVDFITSNALE